MGTAFDFFKNKLGDNFGNNMLVNGEAEPGQTTGWTVLGGATTVIGGVGIYGDFVFKLPAAGGSLVQTVVVPYTPNLIQIFGFFYISQYLQQSPSSYAYLKVVISYNESVTFDIFTMPISTALTSEYAGNFYNPAKVDVNYYLVSNELDVRENHTIKEVVVTMYNNSTADVYCDNIALRLSVGTETTRSAHTNELVVDKYGVDSRYLKYSKNLVKNSSFEIFDTDTFAPADWVGGVASSNTFYTGTHSLKLLATQSTIQTAGINPTTYTGTSTRVSFYHYGADIKAQVFDVTNNKFFTLSAQEDTLVSDATPLSGSNNIIFTANASWVDARNSFSFKQGEFGVCSAMKIKFTNVDTTDLYIDEVMLTPDHTGKWPEVYTSGPISDPAYVVDKRTLDEVKTWTGSFAQYEAIVTKDPRILYHCSGSSPTPPYSLKCVLTATGVVPNNTVINTNANSLNITKSGDSIDLGVSATAFNLPSARLVMLNGTTLKNGTEVMYTTATSFTLPTYTLDAGDIIIVMS